MGRVFFLRYHPWEDDIKYTSEERSLTEKKKMIKKQLDFVQTNSIPNYHVTSHETTDIKTFCLAN